MKNSEKSSIHLKKIQAIGQKYIGQQFFLDQEDILLVEKLIEIFESVKNGESTKGLLIIGPYGCGKTSIAKIVNAYYSRAFLFMTTRYICKQVRAKGENYVDAFSSGYWNHGVMHRIKNQKRIIDDMGQEPEFINHYGNKQYFIKEVLLNVYDNFIEYKLKPRVQPTLIITTNLSIEQIGDRYGGDVQSRLIEMCDIYQYSKSILDKRTLEPI